MRDKIKVEKYRGYQPWLGDDPHLWSFRNLLWDLWGLALDQQNERNKTKAEEQVFFFRGDGLQREGRHQRTILLIMWICCTPSAKWDVRKLRDAPPIVRSVSKNMLLSFRSPVWSYVFQDNICCAPVHSESFPEKIQAPPEVAPWCFHLIVVSHSLACSEGQNKSGKIIRLPNMIGDDPHLWNFRNLLWDLWVLALDQQNKRNKTKAEEQVFFQR